MLYKNKFIKIYIIKFLQNPNRSYRIQLNRIMFNLINNINPKVIKNSNRNLIE